MWYFWDYNSPDIQKIIHSYKFEQIRGLNIFFQLILKGFLSQFSTTEIVPIPSDPKRFKLRGFDHIQELIPPSFISENICLRKIKSTPSQTSSINVKERWNNLQTSFVLQKYRRTKSENIFLVDDLLTSGATAYSAARLLSAYTQNIYLLVLALKVNF